MGVSNLGMLGFIAGVILALAGIALVRLESTRRCRGPGAMVVGVRGLLASRCRASTACL